VHHRLTTRSESLPIHDTATERDELTHIVCRYAVPIHGPVTDPKIRAFCGRNMLGATYRPDGQVWVVCKDMTEAGPHHRLSL
jgi:hypothetical protein